MTAQFKGAAVHVDITPPAGCELDGYADRAGPGEGVHDPITGQLLLLEAEGCRLALITLDLLGVELAYSGRVRDEVAAALETPAELVMVSCSHTHSGLAGFLPGLPGLERPADIGLQDMVCRKLAAAAEVASRSLEWIQLSIGRGEVFGIGTNRNDPQGLFDPEVLVLRMDDSAGNPAAVWMNFGCHPTVLGADNRLLSADYPGAARSALRRIYPETVFLFSNGASGDISTRFHRREQTFREVTRMGHILAGEVLKVMQMALPLEGDGLNGAVRSVELPYKQFPSRATAEEQLIRLRERLGALQEGGTPEREIRTAFTAVQGAQFQLELLERLDGRSGQQSLLQVLRIGDLALAGLPGEPFTRTVLDLKSRRIFPWTAVLSYTNDEAGYFPDRESLREDTYESFISPYSDTITDILTNTTVDLLERIKDA
jgi:neutral ceramidase